MYINWEEKASLLQSFYWYSLSDVTNYLHTLRRFIIHTPAKYAETYAPKLPVKQIPASKTDRFPQESYLCEGVGNWSLELDLLELSVNVMINKNRIIRKYPDYKTPGEVEIYAITKINLLLEMTQQGTEECNIQREDFEHHYGLTWIEKEE